MKIYKLYIETKSSFITYPKGDMLYSFFLYWWNKFGNSIEEIKDKIVFSDFLPDGYFKKPAFEFTKFTNNEDERKEIKSIDWIKEEDLLNGNLSNIIKNINFKFFIKKKSVKTHLNQIYLTTSENFSPYLIEEIIFIFPVVLYVGVDKINIKNIIEFVNKIGDFGFGKKSSTGKGIFQVIKYEKYNTKEGNNYLALSPLITNKKSQYNLFTRYGKFHSTSKPFKNPIVLMDSGSVILEKCNIVEGKIIKDNVYKNYYVQAKSIMLPFKVKD